MAENSKIEWTDTTWNPVTGCSKISQGCSNCYAERMANRLRAMGVDRYRNGFCVTLHPDMLSLPKTWKTPRRVFVNSMSDIFHEAVPEEFILQVFKVMNECPQHTFQVLTKRSKRLAILSKHIIWTKNIWMGVTVENETVIHRISDLLSTEAATKFLSCEPLLGNIPSLPEAGLDWIIVGGESGPFARKMNPEWVETIYGHCEINSIPFFFKQWGGTRKKKAGRLLHNRYYNDMPLQA